jgi:cell volume regulation protein A
MYLIAAIILIAVVLMAALFRQWNMPLIIIALGMGIVFGSDVTGLVYFDDALMTQKLANFALIFILFGGGFGTRRQDLDPVVVPSLSLATLGVLATAFVSAAALHLLLGWEPLNALLMGVIVSSTDAAAIFSILRTRAINQRLASTIEIESAANDPMAIIATTFVVHLFVAEAGGPLKTLASFAWLLIGGAAIGLIVGRIGCLLFERIKYVDRGYFYILTIGVILLGFGAADLLGASGMLSAFFAGHVMGNGKFPYKSGVSTFVGALSQIANVALFVLLGLLVFPKEFSQILWPGVVVFLVITFIGRPVAVILCTLFGKFSWRDRVFMSWSGIRGAVPIVLGTYPVAAGIDNGHQIFNTVFFAVVLSVTVQGTTIGKLADLLRLSVRSKPKPRQAMELVTIHDSDLELVELAVDEEYCTGEARISTLDLPRGTTITMINRREEIIAPRGSTIIIPGDVLFILTRVDEVERVSAEILGRFSGDAEGRESSRPPGDKSC